MFCRRSNATTVLLAAAAILISGAGLSACGSKSNDATLSATPQGTIDLNSLRVGLPESVIQDASITFLPDPKGSIGGKNQYLSGSTDADGGQYVAQCKNGRCFELQVYYNQAPVSKDVALSTMKKLIPADAGPETSLEKAQVRPGMGATPIEVHHFGRDYYAQVAFNDKNATDVILVNAWHTPATQPAAAAPTKP